MMTIFILACLGIMVADAIVYCDEHNINIDE